MSIRGSGHFTTVESGATVRGAEKLVMKAIEVLSQVSGDQISEIKRGRCLELIEETLMKELELSRTVAHDIAFHLTDWWGELVFLVALHLCPERFTQEEIVEGVSLLLAHVPNHLAAGAKLFDLPVQDIFGVGPLEESLETGDED